MIATVCLDPWITPARAGMSLDSAVGLRVQKDYPRMRGDKLAIIDTVPDEKGSPPHARG